jgi:hypothetical protein
MRQELPFVGDDDLTTDQSQVSVVHLQTAFDEQVRHLAQIQRRRREPNYTHPWTSLVG